MLLCQKDIIDKLFEKTGLYKKDIKVILTALNELIYEEMDNDNVILFNNLFKIEPVMTKDRQRFSGIINQYYVDKAHRNIKITPSVNFINSVRKQNTENEDE